MDADGQHPAEQIAEFHGRSWPHLPPWCWACRLGPDAPWAAVGAGESPTVANLETLVGRIGDSLFASRLSIGPLAADHADDLGCAAYDFDPSGRCV